MKNKKLITNDNFEKFCRATNYLSAAQIFLQDNFLLELPLTFNDIKPRLLGHFGTCPGINLLYAHLNHLVIKHDLDLLFILGPGHGFAALQANLFLEGTLSKYYPEYPENLIGLSKTIKDFSWPYGFPSHTNPGTPGAILEGGELGYSLSTAYGAILDNPNLIAVTLIGDGEAETGPMATAWHLNKFIDPKTNGTVLPVLHRNGYKISGPTIFGRMSEDELSSLFKGYGYKPYFVNEESDVHESLKTTLEKCYQDILTIKQKNPIRPNFPMIILTTKKGETGPKELHGRKMEGNYASHQVMATQAKNSIEELKIVEAWLKSYRFEELFDPKKGFVEEIKALIPEKNKRIGDNKHCFGGDKTYKSIKLPNLKNNIGTFKKRGGQMTSNMKIAGEYLKDVIKLNQKNRNFRIFSPDETYSNKLDAVFKETSRAFVWPILEHDEDLKKDGRVIEMLSEHSLQGLMQGYVLTGRHGIFPSYEAFIQIVSSMTDQYAKFLKIARKIKWRGDFSSLNYILTSPGWAQEHNGFSHQNPGFIDNVLQRHGDFVNVYFPADRNSTLVCLEKCFKSKKEINVLVSGKAESPEWVSIEEAKEALKEGLLTWEFASDKNPDLVLASVGDYLTKECLAAISHLKEDLPEIKIRFVNILELTSIGIGSGEKTLSKQKFEKYFTKDKPVIFNFHGYPETIKQILFDVKGASDRFSIHGYLENGSTTTPFDMQARNKTSRLHLAKEAVNLLKLKKVISKAKAEVVSKKYDKLLKEHLSYIKKYGEDPEYIAKWQWEK